MVSVGPGRRPRRIPYRPVSRPPLHRGRRRRRGGRRRGRPLHRAGRGRAAARASCSCRARRWRSRRATGRRAASRRRSTPTTASTCTWPTRCAAGRGADRPAHGRDPLRRGAGARARAGAARDLVRPLGRRRAAAVPRGRAHAPARRARRRQRDRPARDGAAVGAGRPPTSGIEVHERSSALRAVGRGRPLRGRRHRRRRRSRPPRRCSRPAAPRRCGSGTTNPRGAIGAGLTLAHDAGAALADLEFMQFHPTALRCRGDLDGFLVTEAVRGEGALLVTDERRAVRGRARAARRGRARDPERSCARGGARSSTCAPVDMRAFPNIVERLARAGIDPERRPRAGRARGALHDRRRRDRRATAARRCPACTRSASAPAPGVHGANRLASNSLSECFVFGRRAALARGRRSRLPAAERRHRRPPGPPTRPGEETRAALWRDAGLVRDAAGLERLADDPHPLARADREQRARSPREPRLPPALGLPRRRPRAGRAPPGPRPADRSSAGDCLIAALNEGVRVAVFIQSYGNTRHAREPIESDPEERFADVTDPKRAAHVSL